MRFHTENDVFRGGVGVDRFQCGEHPVQTLAVHDAVGTESGEDAQVTDSEPGGDIDNSDNLSNLFFHIVAGEIVAGAAAFEADAMLSEQRLDPFDFAVGRAGAENIPVVVGDGEFQQVEAEPGCDGELGFKRLLAKPPGGETVLHYSSLQSKRILKHSIPFRD